MSTVKLRYIGGLEHVDVPILGREGEPLDEHGEGCLVRGEVFDCAADVAGRAPEYDEAGDVVDYGEGLLAQTSNFEVAAGGKSKKKQDPPAMPAASQGDPVDETPEA